MKFLLFTLLMLVPFSVFADGKSDVICDEVTGLSETDLENQDLHEIILSCLAPKEESAQEVALDTQDNSVASK